MSSLKELGLENKFYVVKREDIMNLLKINRPRADEFLLALDECTCHRMNKGQKLNDYIVVNTDEPYAYKVAALVKGQEITRPIKIKCTSVIWGYNDLMTKGKEYECIEVENGEFWIEDDSGNYNPFPQDCFEVVSI